MILQSNRKRMMAGFWRVSEEWRERRKEISRRRNGMPALRLQKTRRNTIVSVKLDVVERGGDAEPSGHGSWLSPAHMCHGRRDNIAKSQGPADQDYFKLNRGARRQLPGAKKIDAG